LVFYQAGTLPETILKIKRVLLSCDGGRFNEPPQGVFNRKGNDMTRREIYANFESYLLKIILEKRKIYNSRIVAR